MIQRNRRVSRETDVGYAVGAILGGFLYRYLGGRGALQVFSAIAVVCGVLHLVLHKTLLRHHEVPEANGKQQQQGEYRPPAEAALEAAKNSAFD